MAVTDTYKTIESGSSGIYKNKGSKFIAEAYPVSEEKEIREIIENARKNHHEARHHCYAYIISPDGHLWRANDDGEPSGTAGRPILGKIRSYGLTNVVVVVSRYFGGTLLGVSGLINAYKTATDSALSNAKIIDQTVLLTFELTFPYSALKDVMKIIKDEKIIQVNQRLDLDCRITIRFRESILEKISGRFSRIESLGMELLVAG
jgi:uncharacterized YigZ family protein